MTKNSDVNCMDESNVMQSKKNVVTCHHLG
jgi:hypothetical protein